jgi:hypothetical protein
VAQAPPKFDVAQQKQFLHEAQKALKEDNVRKETRRIVQKALEETLVREELQRTNTKEK